MKNKVFYLQLLVFVAIVSAFAPSSASALAVTNDAVSVSVSLNTPTKITLGEPIILHYKVANPAPDKKLGVLMGVYNDAWYTLTLTDQSGKSVTTIPDLRPSEPRGVFIPGDIFLNRQGFNQDQRESYDVVTQLFNLDHPGQYTLKVQVHLPYATAPLSSVGLSDKAVESSGTTLAYDFVFPVTVTPSNPMYLRQTSDGLYQGINSERSDAKRKALIAALFSMPEEQAYTSWELLATRTDWTNREVIAEQLAKVHSVVTINLLVKMLDNSTLSPDEASFIRTKIDESYNAGTDAVKSYIKAVAANRGIEMPDKIIVPQVGD